LQRQRPGEGFAHRDRALAKFPHRVQSFLERQRSPRRLRSAGARIFGANRGGAVLGDLGDSGVRRGIDDFHAKSYFSVRPEPVEGRPARLLARAETSVQSPRVIASFLARLQPLLWRSAVKASSRERNSWERIKVTGRRVKV